MVIRGPIPFQLLLLFHRRGHPPIIIVIFTGPWDFCLLVDETGGGPAKTCGSFFKARLPRDQNASRRKADSSPAKRRRFGMTAGGGGVVDRVANAGDNPLSASLFMGPWGVPHGGS